MKIRKTDEEITQIIKSLPPLNLKEFNSETPEQIQKKRQVSNEDILKALVKIYESYSTFKRFDKRYESILAKNKPKPEQDYFDTKVYDLNFRNSATLFTPQFENLLKNMLEDLSPESLSKEELNQLNDKLHNLSKTEFEWKEYNRRTTTKEVSHEQFKQEYSTFDQSFEKLTNPTKEELSGQRAERKFLKFKVGLFAKALIDYFYHQLGHNSLLFCTTYTVEELGEIIAESLESRRIFNDLSRISIMKAHEKLINHNAFEKYRDDVLSIEKPQLIDKFIKSFSVEIMFILINFGEKTKKINTEVADILCRDIQVEIFQKNLLINIESRYKKEYNQFISLTLSILDIFVRSGFFSNVVSSTHKNHRGKIVSTTQLILQDKLTVEVFRPFKFPNIVRTKPLQKKDIDLLIKPLINGKGDLTKSDSLVSALNISKSKPYKVNELLLKLCFEFFDKNPVYTPNIFSEWLREGFIDLGTVHQTTLREKEVELETLKEISKSTNISFRIAIAISVQFLKRYNKAIPFSNLLYPCGITNLERLIYSTTKHLEALTISDKIDWKYTQSRLFLAQNLKSFPIYVTDILCIRLRKYPREHWLSRTAGQLKHLLENFKPRKLTVLGFINLLKAYYQANPDKLSLYEDFLNSQRSKKRIDKKSLAHFFYKTPLDFTTIRKPMYFMNLHLAILQAIEEKYMTAVNVEVDQNASALVILSLVLRSRKMAETCNVIGGLKKVSPYDYIKSKVREFFNNHAEDYKITDILNPENQDVYNFICNSRNLHKYAIMCFCYNQTTLGRLDDFSAEWVKELGYYPNPTQKSFLNRFASMYEDFVEFVYPKTKRKLEILKELVHIVCNEAPKLSMRTLDGEVINWAFYATSVTKRKYYDAVDRKHKSYSISTFKVRRKEITNNETNENLEKTQRSTEFPCNLQLDSRGMKRRFLSYLIHSIDASILRRIINKMKKEHNSSVNHLHDCIILHPNDLEALYITIKDIYSSPDIYNLIEYGVFGQIESNLSPEGREKLNKLKLEFFSLTDDFQKDLAYINPQHMYSLED